jgi:hypothetical protein
VSRPSAGAVGLKVIVEERGEICDYHAQSNPQPIPSSRQGYAWQLGRKARAPFKRVSNVQNLFEVNLHRALVVLAGLQGP